MCLFARNRSPKIEGKYKIYNKVVFKHNNEQKFGYVYNVYLDQGVAKYDVQIGGECPVVIKGLKEEELKEKK